jgi:hypothetical protein
MQAAAPTAADALSFPVYVPLDSPYRTFPPKFRTKLNEYLKMLCAAGHHKAPEKSIQVKQQVIHDYSSRFFLAPLTVYELSRAKTFLDISRADISTYREQYIKSPWGQGDPFQCSLVVDIFAKSSIAFEGYPNQF